MKTKAPYIPSSDAHQEWREGFHSRTTVRRLVVREMNKRSWSASELASRMNCTVDRVEQILDWDLPMSMTLAIQLNDGLGGGAEFWLALNQLDQETLAMRGWASEPSDG